MQQSQERLVEETRLKVEGVDSLTAEALILALKSSQQIILQSEFEVGAEDIVLHVKPFQRGSFEIVFELQEFLRNNPELFDYIKIFSLIRTIVKGVYKLISKEKGKQPTIKEIKDGNLIIIDSEGVEYSIPVKSLAVYNDEDVQKSIQKSLKSLAETKDVEGVNYIDSDNSKIYISRSTIEDYVFHAPVVDQITNTQRETLTIIRMSFEPNFKWMFSKGSEKIIAKITDENFWSQVNRGEKFSKGDSLNVILEVTKELDKANNIYIPKSYTIIKVENKLSRPIQLELI